MGNNKNKLPDVFDTEQLVKLFDTIDDPKTAIASSVAFFCGLRINEVCSLRVRDINFETRKLKITDSKYTRRNETGYGKDRYVPFPKEMVSPIKKWIDVIDSGEWFIPSNQSPDRPLRKKTLYENYRHFLKKAGLSISDYKIVVKKGKAKGQVKTKYKYYFHTLRHSYATYLLSKGVDIMTISGLLGHNQVTTTQIYARVNTVQASAAIDEAFGTPLMEGRPSHRQLAQSQMAMESQIELEKIRLEVEKQRLELKKMELQVAYNQ